MREFFCEGTSGWIFAAGDATELSKYLPQSLSLTEAEPKAVREACLTSLQKYAWHSVSDAHLQLHMTEQENLR